MRGTQVAFLDVVPLLWLVITPADLMASTEGDALRSRLIAGVLRHTSCHSESGAATHHSAGDLLIIVARIPLDLTLLISRQCKAPPLPPLTLPPLCSHPLWSRPLDVIHQSAFTESQVIAPPYSQ